MNCVIVEFGPELSEGTEDEMKTFNEDIVCSHGTLHQLMFDNTGFPQALEILQSFIVYEFAV